MSLFRRKPQPPERTRLFDDLTPKQEQEAQRRLSIFLASHRHPAPWLYPILIGQARRLTLNPPDSAWGHKMLAKRGGYAVQRMYRAEGRHPTQKATLTRTKRQAAVKQAREPGFARSGWCDLTGI